MGSSSLVQIFKRHPRAVAASIGLHVVLLILLSISLTSSEVPQQPASSKKTVKAVIVDTAQVEKEIEKLKQAEKKKQQKTLEQKKKTRREAEQARKKREQEKKRLAALKKKEQEKKKQADIKRKKESEKKKQAELERKKKREAEKKSKQEQQRKAELEKQRKLEEQRKAELEKQRKLEAERKRKEEEALQKKLAEEAEKRRLAEEAELKRRLAEEEQRVAEHNRKLNSLRLQYVKLIEQRVESKWLRPSAQNSGQSCEVYVRQTALGDVISVHLKECSSDVAFQHSIERAVWAASPLPLPPNPEVFDNEIHFVFRPRT